MELYIGPLDSGVTVSELQRFFKGFENKANFTIKRLVREGGKHCYGLAVFDSDRHAMKAIKKLHATKLHDTRVFVREFQHRASSNDRRALNWRDTDWTGQDRRRQERRRQYQICKEFEPTYEAYDNLAIKHL